jgi:adenine-specific DNA-methyltransferase
MSEDIKLPLASPDPAADLLAQLRAAAPQVFGEGKVDFDKLRTALGGNIDAGPERYGLTWAGKSDAFRNVQASSVGTLLPMPEESVDWDNTENLIIEGDNLEVLKLLQKSYHGKVKMIYIDPPYNTGNEFIYPDNYREGLEDYLRYSGQVSDEGIKQSTNTETSGRFHSKWLSMMYPRLFLARNLLREDGVIFVSIDDNEVHDLRALMNEVFGEENFIAQLIWEKTRKNDAKLFSVGHDYMIVYARSMTTIKEEKTVWREAKPGAKEIMEHYRELRKKHGADDSAIQKALREWYSLLPKTHPSKKLSRYKWVDKYGPWRDRDISWPGGGGPRYDVPHPTTKLPCKVPERGWGFASWESMKRQIDLDLVVFRDDHTDPPYRKAHLLPVPEELDDEVELESEGEDVTENDAQTDEEEESVGLQVMPSVIYKQSQVAVKYLRKLLGGKIFDNPKDHEIITRLVRYCVSSDANDLVLDCFSGSGTTGEAVFQANMEDDGHRRFILVQLPEPIKEKSRAYAMGYRTISQVTRDRVRKAGGRIRQASTKQLNQLAEIGDLGFKAFSLSSSNFKIWDAEKTPDNPEKLAEQLKLYADNVERKRGPQDILYELILKSGLPLSSKVEKTNVAGKPVWSVNGSQLLVYLENPVTREVLRGMLGLKPQQMLCLDTAFGDDDALKTNTVLEAKAQGVVFHTV